MAYTTIDDPSAYFQTALYTGNGTGQTITNDGNSDLQPDFLWFKNRDETVANILWDSSRGITKFLISEQTAADFTNPAGYELTSFNTDGFGLGIHNTAGINQSASFTYACWQWKANGGTTASNSDGSITSTVQANQDAGFSIVTYTTAGSTATIGHGLGAKPDVILLKKRNGAIGWLVRHVSTGTSYLSFNSIAAAVSNPAPTWTTTEPTTSVYSIGTSTDVNIDGGEYVAYCFAEKQGYSKFGKYVGNGNANGPFVYLGFKPAWVMIKNASINGNWYILDAKRSPSNLVNKQLTANGNGAEFTSPAYFSSDFLSNGFKLRTNEAQSNNTGNTYIYMAFAENPFVTSTGVPTTAR
jgi:hypothetical protein